MYQNGICFITDRTYARLPLYDMVRSVLEAGITLIQYREKEKTRHEIYDEAVRLRELTRSFRALLIINDHADIALAVDADGVHLGQDDLPLNEARKIICRRLVPFLPTALSRQSRQRQEGPIISVSVPFFGQRQRMRELPKGLTLSGQSNKMSASL